MRNKVIQDDVDIWSIILCPDGNDAAKEKEHHSDRDDRRNVAKEKEKEAQARSNSS